MPPVQKPKHDEYISEILDLEGNSQHLWLVQFKHNVRVFQTRQEAEEHVDLMHEAALRVSDDDD